MNKKELKAKLLAELRELSNKAKTENRSFTADEQKAYDEKMAEVRKLTAEIENEEREAELNGFSSELPKPEAGKEERKDETFIRATADNKGLELRTDMKVGTSSSQGGGYAIAPQKFYDQIQEIIQKEALLYPRVDKIRASGSGSLGIPYESVDASDAAWTAEIPSDAISADSAWAFAKRELIPTDLTKLIKITKKLVAATPFDIEQIAIRKIALKLMQAYEKAITVGDGDGEPLGVFYASDNGIPTSRDVSTTGKGTGVITGDDLIEMYLKVRPQVRKGAVWIMNTAILKDVMKLKDNDGQYLWQESLRAGEPSTLLGLPVLESEFAPTAKTANSYMIVLGNLDYYKFAYWKDIEITIANESFAGKNQIGIYGHTLADGCPINPEAFARLKAVYVG